MGSFCQPPGQLLVVAPVPEARAMMVAGEPEIVSVLLQVARVQQLATMGFDEVVRLFLLQ